MNDWLYHYAATVLKVVDGDTIDSDHGFAAREVLEAMGDEA